jgi:hypothetical protein
MNSMDQLVADYQANLDDTCQTLAARYGLKPADVAAILRLHGIKLRRGRAGNITPEARAKGHAARSAKALRNQLNQLLNKYAASDLCKLIVDLEDEREDTSPTT